MFNPITLGKIYKHIPLIQKKNEYQKKNDSISLFSIRNQHFYGKKHK